MEWSATPRALARMFGVGVAIGAAAAAHAATAAAQACADYLFVAGMESTASAAPCRLAGTTAVFTDRAAFLAALANGHVENAFDDVVAGASGGLRYAQNRIEYVLYTQPFADGWLYNGPGFVSTDRIGDAVTVYQLGIPVTAIGGEFWATDFLLAPADGFVEVALDDGTLETIPSTGPGTFRGFISATPIGRLMVDVPAAVELTGGESPDRWPALDNLIIGDGK